MKILWHSVPSGNPSGYGQQTDVITKRLARKHEVTISSTVGTLFPYEDKNGILTLPSSPIANNYGNKYILDHVRKIKPDIVVSLLDPFVVDKDKFSQLPWLCWSVVDGYPLNPACLDQLRKAKGIMAMTDFAKIVMDAADLKSTVVPHGIESNTFFPYSKDAARERMEKELHLDLDGKFVACAVSANSFIPNRKNFSAMFEIWSEFVKQHPDSLLYVHSNKTTMRKGYDLERLARFYGLNHENIVFAEEYEYVCGGYSTDYLNMIYNASDVFLHTSFGESFGLPLVEAQMAGTPVVSTGHSAMSEVVRSGHLVKYHQRMVMPEVFWGDIHRKHAVDSLCSVVESEYEKEKVREKVLDFDADNVVNRYLEPAIVKLHEELQ